MFEVKANKKFPQGMYFLWILYQALCKDNFEVNIKIAISNIFWQENTADM